MSFRSLKSKCLSLAIAFSRRVSNTLRFSGRSIRVHPSGWISLRSVIRVNGGGSISIGRNCEIHPFSMLLTYGGDVHLGDNCSVNPFTIIYGCGGAYIGNNVRIAAHVMIVPENHNPGTDATPLPLSGKTRKGIRIEDNVWIGAGAKILDGVSIGRNAVIGAGSVVTRSVPENATAVGVPARVLTTRTASAAVQDAPARRGFP
jgi:acetyltransferase-like isoleucine patch superfamily enzyme